MKTEHPWVIWLKTPPALTALTYLLLVYALAFYTLGVGGAGPGDLFPGVAYLVVTAPVSVPVLWYAVRDGETDPTLLNALLWTLPVLNLGIAVLVWRSLRRVRHWWTLPASPRGSGLGRRID